MSIVIDCEVKGGKLVMDVKGAKGKECEDLTKELESAIGKVSDKRKKPEYYERKEIISHKTKVR